MNFVRREYLINAINYKELNQNTFLEKYNRIFGLNMNLEEFRKIVSGETVDLTTRTIYRFAKVLDGNFERTLSKEVAYLQEIGEIEI
ncbi:MAG: hypothetical protein ACRC0V_08415 [Fusobacteriaceae bacterium]